MSAEFGKTSGNIKRKVEELSNSSIFYGIWAMVVMVAFLFFGIRPLQAAIREKFKLLGEMRDVNTALSTKVYNLEKVREDLDYSRSFISYFDASMPGSAELQNYMLDFVNAASRSGYILKSIYPMVGGFGLSLSIESTLEGNGNPYELVKNLESLKRITKVERLSIERTETGDKVSLSVVIYSYKEQ